MTYADREMRGATLFAKLVEALAYHSPASYADMIEHTGLSYHTCMRYCRAMRNLDRPVVRIHHWDRDAADRPSIPMFELSLSQKPDAKRPSRTKEQKAEQCRMRRLEKKLQAQNSVFNMHVPRYAEGSR